MSRFATYLLPDNASVDSEGQLCIGGLRATDLAEEFGTPLFVYDEDHLRMRMREAVAAFGPGVAYASKAFLCGAVARMAHEEGMKIDVASGGELFVALRAGVPGERIVLHGNNKSDAELIEAIEANVSKIVVDSFDEFDRLERLLGPGGTHESFAPQPIMIRVTPGIEVHTFDEVQTGQVDSKFGFGWGSGDAHRAAQRANDSGAVELLGLHVHIGSQVFSVDNFASAIEMVAPLAKELAAEEFCVGGGLGVAYVDGEEGSTISAWAAAVKRVCAKAGIDADVTAEPGRSIVAQAGMTLYRVGTIKRIPGVRTYVAVDGGMSDNPRPVLYGSGYETFLPRAVTASRPDVVRVVGKHCESGDVLVREAALPADLAVGDIVCTPVTGAYGHSMGSNYNKVPRPAVVFVSRGSARLVVRRETYDDLTRLDLE
ncbi:MAG TPA: diaminopimelate decarboxylase [Microthrixaceae bacterium]|nr:diaminopimelate decarboxylase [Microthrixaceae bacterium]HPB45850.1 diaminopimelate decarboxylase [Microthrixaceae bacterium]